MSPHQEVKENLKSLGYLLLGYSIVIITILIGIELDKINQTLSTIVMTGIGCLIVYPLGKQIANWFKRLFTLKQ